MRASFTLATATRERELVVTTLERSTYHHGDLRTVLLSTGVAMLEAGEPFSLRALARQARVSPAAPYRHFADRSALESALAVQGLQDLMRDLTQGRSEATSSADVADLAVRYVQFALRRPAMFRLMFGRECDHQDDERIRAATALHDYLAAVMADVFPDADAQALAMAGWSLAHGLACLHLDGKFASSDQSAVDERVRSTVAAVFPRNPTNRTPRTS